MLRAALALIGLPVAALVGGQLALPRIAERRITSDLSESGRGQARARSRRSPRVKLLFKRADRVEVEMAEVRAGNTGRLVQLLRRTRGTYELDARADLVTLGPLRLHAAVLRKDGDLLRGEATVSEAELAAALPQPAAPPPGRGSLGRAGARGRRSARSAPARASPPATARSSSRPRACSAASAR